MNSKNCGVCSNCAEGDYDNCTAFTKCAECTIKDAKYTKLRELAEKVATAGYYTHPLAGAIDELRNYLKEVK